MLKNLIIALVLGAVSVTASAADAVADFYKDKKVTVVIRSGAGGTTDTYGRIVARHIGKYIPGNPEVVAVNMDGAGGIIAANYTQNKAPRDGTEFTLIAPASVIAQRQGAAGVQYDLSTWNFVGSLSGGTGGILVAKESGITTVKDLINSKKRLKMAMTSKSSGAYLHGIILQQLGADVEFIMGFDGTGEKAKSVARQDTDVTSGSFRSTHKRLKKHENLVMLATLGNTGTKGKYERLEDHVPADKKKVFNILTVGVQVGYPFGLPPEVPAERVDALRTAFLEMSKDADFLAEAKKLKVTVDPMPGQDILPLYDDILSASDAEIAVLD